MATDHSALVFFVTRITSTFEEAERYHWFFQGQMALI